jgi:hypothetical protein
MVYSRFIDNFVDEQFSDIDGKTLLREGYQVDQGDIIQQF